MAEAEGSADPEKRISRKPVSDWSEGGIASASESAGKPEVRRSTRVRRQPNHPKVSEMVNTAILKLKGRNGSSLQAIKKYMASHYRVDVKRLAPFIRNYINNAVYDGILIQTKGRGASGSFKIRAAALKPGFKPRKARRRKRSRTRSPRRKRRRSRSPRRRRRRSSPKRRRRSSPKRRRKSPTRKRSPKRRAPTTTKRRRKTSRK